MNVLVDTWNEMRGRHRHEIALADVVANRAWTFDELDEASTQRASAFHGRRVIFAGGGNASFVIDTLAAWKANSVLCPLDAGTVAPASAIFDDLPAGIVLAKLTSGSTGGPRIVLFRAEQLAADAANIIATMGLGRARPNVGAISLAHSYGFSNLVLPLLLEGIPLRLAGSSLPEAVRRALPDRGGAVLPGVPAMWRAWHAARVIDHRVGLAISAGAPLPIDLERDVLADAGVKIHNFLGSSECGGIAYDRTDALRGEATLAGTAMENVKLELDAEGRLVVCSAAVGEGYWPPAIEDRAVIGPNRFRTNDLADLRKGSVYLLGRAGDVINVAGRKVHPAEIETCLRQHPAVAECVVFGVPAAAEDRGDDIAVCVAASAGTESLDHLIKWLADRLPAWKRPRHWRLTPHLSPNQRGKISRREWRERFLKNEC
jgi:acyl-CoA synthetase (AMP-forming)/AMP-acid ligase II